MVGDPTVGLKLKFCGERTYEFVIPCAVNSGSASTFPVLAAFRLTRPAIVYGVCEDERGRPQLLLPVTP
jgi:hypothetical protein